MKRLVVAFGILAVLAWIFFPRPKNPYGRETYILVSDPMIVASWNGADRTLTLLTLPSEIAAEGTHGYGTYSLAAFWRLGEIDKKDGTVLAESVSEALGIPVTGYVGPKTGAFVYDRDALTTVKKIFSFPNSIPGRFRTNIPFRKYIAWSWLLNFSRPDRVNTYDFTKNPDAIGEDSVLADGSIVRILDSQRIDAALNTLFEDEAVRRESVTVAVYNTTDMPSLGSRVGRLLTNLGVSVVTVGNDSPQTDVCVLQGSEDALKSKSARVIVSILGCTEVAGEVSRADLLLHVGANTAKRFRPN